MSQLEKSADTRSEKKAKEYRLYKFIALTVLVVFLLVGLVLFKNDITVENVRYLIKYLDFSSSGAFSQESQIHYHADSTNRFHVFRGDLALVNGSGITLYDRRGSAVMTDRYSMTHPICVCADRYLVVYDLGGHQVRVYNSFALLFEKNFDYVIQSVSVNDDGDFCVVTSEKSYHSAVFVYDRDFQEIQTWFSSDKFAVDANLSDNDILTVSAIRVDNGALLGELVELELGKESKSSSFAFSGEMPLSHSTDRKGTLLLTNESLKYIKAGEQIRSAAFPRSSLSQAVYGDRLCAVVQNELSVGVNFRLRVFDREANEVFSQKFSVQIRDVQIWEDTVYVLTHTSLFALRAGEEMVEYSLSGDYSSFGVLGDRTIILCSETTADIRIFN